MTIQEWWPAILQGEQIPLAVKQRIERSVLETARTRDDYEKKFRALEKLLGQETPDERCAGVTVWICALATFGQVATSFFWHEQLLGQIFLIVLTAFVGGGAEYVRREFQRTRRAQSVADAMAKA